jgi:hypothetical protein
MHRWLRLGIVFMLVMVISVGIVALAKKPGPGGGTCPDPTKGWACPMYYAPVVCGPDDCWYSNDCFASLAGWDASDCTPVGPGPVPI